ncbi:MAG: hypothetical protein KBD26_03525 [Candidatus Pacebacteria bacterium]|nr:hypothetical protein [Candidatus Paceibacterota bacterium]MBP9772875.1 hypothetical protein [Candidatus Paceibacterota bacterium]
MPPFSRLALSTIVIIIQASDVEEAVENLYKQNLDLNHNDEIAEIIEDSGKRLITFSRHK